MSSSIVNVPPQHVCPFACPTIVLSVALQHTKGLAYLEYCELPLCSSPEAVLNKLVKMLGSKSKNKLKQWILLLRPTISEVDVSAVSTTLYHPG
jgi:hypothetical protein